MINVLNLVTAAPSEMEGGAFVETPGGYKRPSRPIAGSRSPLSIFRRCTAPSQGDIRTWPNLRTGLVTRTAMVDNLS
jgi:hypothetical protein